MGKKVKKRKIKGVNKADLQLEQISFFHCHENRTSIIHIGQAKGKGFFKMAHFGSKGWLVKQLKEAGVTRHPIDRRKLEVYKASTLFRLYEKYVLKSKKAPHQND
jgi:hypothetical protein